MECQNNTQHLARVAPVNHFNGPPIFIPKNLVLNCLFQQEFFAYPMVQNELKREINRLLEEHSLSYEVFQEIFPNLGEISKTGNKSKVLTEIFRQFAEHPKEICERVYWKMRGEGKDFKEAKGYLDMTRCGFIYESLMSSICGNKRKEQFINLKVVNKTTLEKAWKTIESNTQFLGGTPSINFFAYGFQFSNAKNFPGHVALVIQSLNEKGEEEYAFFQSYVREFCLKSYLNKNSNILNKEQFKEFLKGLQECVLEENWTASTESFYTKYFIVKKKYTIGQPNPCKENLRIEFVLGNMPQMVLQNEKFKAFKNVPIFPDLEASGCECCEVKVIKIKTTEELERERIKFEALDKKLYDLFIKMEPITGFEPLQVNLDSLGLDLNELSKVYLPVRGENGKLIVEDGEEQWSMQPITIRSVAHVVVAEINKALIAKGVQKGEVLLNDNKDPLRSYRTLGLPKGKFIITEENAHLIWIDRIIESLIKQKYITKLISINGHGYFLQV